MQLKKLFYWLAPLVLIVSSCKNMDGSTAAVDTAKTDGHPAWVMQGNIYEVNVRQYTPEGTFKAFAQHLDRLQKMGVQTLWFMPINPISKVDRKGTLGSYYAVSNYTAINPEFGTLDEWKELVTTIHEKGMKVIIDWVPNHTGADHYWLTQHPDFYVKDAAGKPLSPYDWTDARKLNYQNPVLCDSMIASMQFWLKETAIDGFRCDVAGDVPDAFWTRCITTLKTGNNIFMLAEGDKPSLHTDGFDATYSWSDFAMMKLIAKGERKANALDSTINKTDTAFPPNSLRLFFTSNHDENSWNQADYATMPGNSHAPFAVITQTMKRSISLIYSGQEEPFLRSLRFFDKDTLTFNKFARADFYTQLLALRKRNSALAANANFTKLVTDADTEVYAFVREMSGKKVLIITNLSEKNVNTTIKNALVKGTAKELFTGTTLNISDTMPVSLPAWGYLVYEY